MKKISVLFAFLLVAAVTFVGCKKDEEEKPGPSISFANGISSFEIDYATVTADPYTVVVIPTVTAEAEISTLTVKKKDATGASSTITITGSYAGKTTFTENFNLPIASTENFPIQIIFNVTDKNDNGMEKIFTITKKVVSVPSITTLTSVNMGAQSNSKGSYASLTSGTVYLTSELTATTSANVDVVYKNVTNDLFLAPTNSNVTTTALTVKNATKFAAYSGSKTFAEITDVDVNDFADPTAEESSALSNGSMVVFKTESGKKGIMKVTAITAGASGEVTFDVKVQQ